MSAHPNGESLSANDGELLSRFSTSGDQRAFSQLVGRHGPMVLRICRRISGGDPHGAEDAAQEVFLMLASRANALKTRMSVAGWLYRTAWHVATRQRRNLAVRDDHETRAGIERAVTSASAAAGDDGRDPIPFALVASELSDAMSRALSNLPENYRNALVLHHVAGYTVEETAAMLGVKVGTAASWMSRGRSMMRDRLEVVVFSGVSAQMVAEWFAEYAPQHQPLIGEARNLNNWGSSSAGQQALASAATTEGCLASALLGAPARGAFGKVAGVVGAAAAGSLPGVGASAGIVAGGAGGAGAVGVALAGGAAATTVGGKAVAVATAAVGATAVGGVMMNRDPIPRDQSTRSDSAPPPPPPPPSSSSPSKGWSFGGSGGGGTIVPEPSFALPLMLLAAFVVLVCRGRRRPARG
jgi:RNA polymerase sigma factor (sigma-70 family)